MNWGPFDEFFFEKKSRNAEKTDRLGFLNIHSVAKLQKIQGGPFGGKKFSKFRTMPKKTERGPFSLAQ